MDQRTNYLSLILLDALEDENEGDIFFILDRNANAIDPGCVPQDRGIAPLHYVCGMNNEKLAIDITKRFLDMGANPNCKSEDNMTPLHVAAMYGKVEIVLLLLQNGAELEVYDDEGKTPVIYAIEECHFEVVQVMRDHIFLDKYAKKKEINSILLSESKFENSLQSKSINKVSTPVRTSAKAELGEDQQFHASPQCINKSLLKVTAVDDLYEVGKGIGSTDNGKYTPNRINYNYDVTSPYYINITHRRHKPQPKFPEDSQLKEHLTIPSKTPLITNKEEVDDRDVVADEISEANDILSISMQNIRITTPEPEECDETVNIFSLTRENLKELMQRTSRSRRSKTDLIETWREKVQKSKDRQSIIQPFEDDVIDEIVENKNQVNNNGNSNENATEKKITDIEIDSGACDNTSSSSDMEITQYRLLPNETKSSFKNLPIGPMTIKQNVSNVLETVQEDHQEEPDTEIDAYKTPSPPQQYEIIDLDSSYQTVPEIKISSPTNQVGSKNDNPNSSTNFIRSPKNDEYFLQMAEAYVHTDDENGLVFYETRLPSNVGNKIANRRNPETPKNYDGNTTATSQSTNVTIPLDYETDNLRNELTIFGDPPGPITKSTKRLYMKRLMKYKRKTELVEELKLRQKENETKFSIELQRTTKSEEQFQRIQDYMKYETQSMQFFINNQNRKQLREGHLKQSFIYMLIDPRISCNLPGESAFLEKFDVWKRFLQSIFYVGKGKTSRPYSHLYDAMRAHSRLHNKESQERCSKTGKKISIKKQPLNVEMFKSPPQKSSDSKKLDRILNIWGNGYGVVCLHVFHNIVPTEAYTREAAIIDSLSLQHLTNCKRGDYYGPAKSWSMKEKKYLGIALLFKAMHIYLAEGESQLSPSDLI
ncbi:uncharacterized protein LOC142228259 [Haematobia irritans]|uniref:uncharacterized protein LOC142228259 n=1 Tax=Haematobia irritans TaxID=7368 RepID=UPI003F506317